MKHLLCFFMILFMLHSCKIIVHKTDIDNGFDTIPKMIQIDKFKFINKKDFENAEYRIDTSSFRIKDLSRLDDTLIMKKWFGLDYYNFYDIYYYSIQKKVHNIRPLTFLMEGADYSAILLLLVDTKTGNVIKTIEIYGGDESGPLKNKFNESIFLNDSTFILKEVNQQCDSFFIGAIITIDTIKFKYTISQKNGFDIEKFDSIRIKTIYK